MQQRLPGGAPATPPAQQTFWVASAAGPGPQQLTWTPTDGRWAVAVMNADGSRPVDVDLSAGATLPHLQWLWIGLFVGAALALVAGAVLVVLAVRRARRSEPAPADRPGSAGRSAFALEVESRCRCGSPTGSLR